MAPQAQTIIHAAELHYRAVIAEAILSGRDAGSRDPEKPDVAASFLRMLGKSDDAARKALVERLLTADLSTRPLTKAEKEDLRRWVYAGDGLPMVQRSKLPERWANILLEGGKLDPDDMGRPIRWNDRVLRWFFPDLPRLATDSDGRPDDMEPGEPTEEDETGTPDDFDGTPPVPPTELRFMVDEIECHDTTGEVGQDEIHYSGLALEGPAATSLLPAAAGSLRLDIRDAGQFRKRTRKDESGLPPFHIYDLAGVSFPRLYIVYVTMAEIDGGGGFSGYMSDLQQSLSAELQTTWSLALIAYLEVVGGLAIDGAILGGPVGAAIGAAIGIVVGAVVVSAFYPNRDDLFEYRSVILELQSNALALPPFNGDPVSDTRTLSMIRETVGTDARYSFRYHWELVGASLGTGSQDADPPVPVDAD
ncbi:hypothetical protein [Tropicibacter sp. S64]|uniref:hypothetical protein n=1 Tax=Tropicibacter sp. S64 TaxID=3415122 RepID=UPI003C7C76B6